MLVKKKLHKLKIRKYHNNSKNLHLKKPASRGNKNMAELLATKGANSNIKNSDGKSALDFARIRGYGEIYEILRAQSFTFLMADHLSVSRHVLEGIAWLRNWYINPNEKSNNYLQIFSSGFTFQIHNRALPLRKCSFKAPTAKC